MGFSTNYFAIASLCEPVQGLGGDIHHIFDVKSSNKQDHMDHLNQSNISMINLFLLHGETQVNYIDSKTSKEKSIH